MIIRYEIRKGKTAPCELVSIVPTNFGGDATNFVAEGTHTYCSRIKEQLESGSTVPLPEKHVDAR